MTFSWLSLAKKTALISLSMEMWPPWINLSHKKKIVQLTIVNTKNETTQMITLHKVICSSLYQKAIKVMSWGDPEFWSDEKDE